MEALNEGGDDEWTKASKSKGTGRATIVQRVHNKF